MNKKIIPHFAFLFFLYSSILSQSVNLNFDALYNNTTVAIDSIHIINTDRQCSDVIYAPQTTYTLNSTVHINKDDYYGAKAYVQNYPNPFKEKTSLNVYLEETQPISLYATDISGKEVARFSRLLESGTHTLSFAGGAAGIYIITLETPDNTYSVKVHKTDNGINSHAVINYEGIKELSLRKSSTKNFQWVPGDHLVYVAFASAGLSTTGVGVIADVPQADTTYLFDMQTNTCTGLPFVADIDGNIYSTVQIGSQCWMRETLHTSTYNNGTPIPLVTDNAAWSGQSSGAYTYFDNDPTTASTYGFMYNGHAVIAGNLCPAGWHVPSISEWQQLATYLGANNYHCGTNTSWVAKAMASNIGWSYAAHSCAPGNNLATNNASGLSVMPAGFRNHSDGLFYTQYERAYIWTTDAVQGFPNSYYYIFLDYSDFGITTTFMSDIRAGHTVRCVKD